MGKINIPYVESLSKLLDIPLDETIDTFSEGMQKKAEILISISHQPLYCIWDEPFYGLDLESIDIVKNDILKKFKFGIVTSHLISPTDRVINLNEIIKSE